VVTIYADNAVRVRAGPSNVKITELMREAIDEWLTGERGGAVVRFWGLCYLEKCFPTTVLHDVINSSAKISGMNSHHYALDCITSLFNMQPPKCFGIRLPSSGSFLDPSDLLKKQNNYVVCHIIKCYVFCFSGSTQGSRKLLEDIT
jgi:hypothetical protein